MTPTRPGNEPDPGDMSDAEGGSEVPGSDLPDADAESLGDFA